MARRPQQSPILTGAAFLAPVLLVLGIWLGGHPNDLPGFVRDALVGDSDAQTIDRAIDQVHDTSYRETPRQKLVNAALSGMTASLHDRFSQYFSPRKSSQFQESPGSAYH